MSLGQADPGADAVYVPVQLPSLFVLFLSKTPDLNPHYAEAKVRVGKVVGRPVKRSRCRFDERARTSLEKTDFSYFCSVAAPKAGREELRTICDWTNWVFPFDDTEFDNGKLRDDPIRAQEVVEDLLAGLGMECSEYAHHLDVPDAVFECASIKEIQRIEVDLVLIQNDILSYCKEETESVPHNLVSITWHTRPNLSAQSAFDSVSAMLNDRYRDWYTALSEFPSWGGPVDAHVRGYVEGVRAVVRANLGWSFRSKRYFGDRVDEVRQTGTVMARRELKPGVGVGVG